MPPRLFREGQLRKANARTALTYRQLQVIFSVIPLPVPLWRLLNHLRNQ
jgi:hypothetical protein